MAKQRKLWKLLPLARAIGIVSAVGIATTFVTFAALQSNGSALTGNTIQTATAALQVSKDDATYGDSMAGFAFDGLVPGGSAQPVANNYVVYVKNVGTATQLVSLNIPTAPTVVGTVDLAKVSVLLTPYSGGSTQTFTLASLIAGPKSISGAMLLPGNKVAYRVQVIMNGDAVTGGSATISNLDLSFSGTV